MPTANRSGGLLRATRALLIYPTQASRGALLSHLAVSPVGTCRDLFLQPFRLIQSAPLLFFRSAFVSSALGYEHPTRRAGIPPFVRSLDRRSPVRSRARPSIVCSWWPCAAFVDRPPCRPTADRSFARALGRPSSVRGGLAPPSSIARRRVSRSIARSVGRSRRRSRAAALVNSMN